MKYGYVRSFNDKSGYGFIETKETEDIFIHYSEIKQEGHKTLLEGQLVSFELIITKKGYQAKNVIVLKDEIIV